MKRVIGLYQLGHKVSHRMASNYNVSRYIVTFVSVIANESAPHNRLTQLADGWP